MSKSFIPQGYRSKLGLYDTQNAIEIIKSTFLESLSAMLRLKRVSAPLFVNPAEGLNDNLNGVERPVSFDIPGTGRQRRGGAVPRQVEALCARQIRLPPRQGPRDGYERHPPRRSSWTTCIPFTSINGTGRRSSRRKSETTRR